MKNKLLLDFVLGGIITLFGTAYAVEGNGVVDYSVNNLPGSPGDSSGKARMEKDVKNHRAAVRDANDAHERAITRHGPKSQEAREAGRNLDDKHGELTRNLYQQGRIPGSPSSAQRLSNDQDGKSTPVIPVRQIQF